MAIYTRYCRGENMTEIAKDVGVNKQRIGQIVRMTSERLARFMVHQHQEVRASHTALLRRLYDRAEEAFDDSTCPFYKNPSWMKLQIEILKAIRGMWGCDAPQKVSVSHTDRPPTLAFFMAQIQAELPAAQIQILADRAERMGIQQAIDTELADAAQDRNASCEVSPDCPDSPS